MSTFPNCWKCRFFKISWDPKFPYECEAMGFKSQLLPCRQVISVDGRPCQSFAGKVSYEKPHTSKDSEESSGRLA